VLAVDFVVEHLDERAMTWAWAVEARRALLPVPRALGRWARMRLVHAVRERAPRGAAAAVGSTTTLEVSGVAPAVLGYALPAWVALRLLVR
jgi:ABC-type microcin C transport system permease subunit YejB